jgi:uncharacterized protein
MNLKKITDLVLDHAATDVSRHSEQHGPRHWRDVARMGQILYEDSKLNVNPELIFLFALLHDSQRLNEYNDPDHGLRASFLVEGLILNGTLPESAEVLIPILIAHDQGLTSVDPLTGLCWDADRLTLWRVGVVPDSKYASTDLVKERFEFYAMAGMGLVQVPDITWDEIIRGYQHE